MLNKELLDLFIDELSLENKWMCRSIPGDNYVIIGIPRKTTESILGNRCDYCTNPYYDLPDKIKLLSTVNFEYSFNLTELGCKLKNEDLTDIRKIFITKGVCKDYCFVLLTFKDYSMLKKDKENGGKNMDSKSTIINPVEAAARECAAAEENLEAASADYLAAKEKLDKTRFDNTIVISPGFVKFDQEKATTVALWPDGTKSMCKAENPDTFDSFSGWAWLMLVKATARERGVTDREAKTILMNSYACAERQNKRSDKTTIIRAKMKEAKKASSALKEKRKESVEDNRESE